MNNPAGVAGSPRRCDKQRGIKRKILNAPRGGELILYPPQAARPPQAD